MKIQTNSNEMQANTYKQISMKRKQIQAESKLNTSKYQ